MNITIKKYFLVINYILFCSGNIVAQQISYDSLINKGVKEIYNVKLSDASLTFAQLKEKFPQKPASLFFSAMILWWKILLNTDDEQYDKLFFNQLENIIDFCDNILDEDEGNLDALFFKGGSIGYRGRLNALRKNWLDAAADGKEALGILFKAYEIDSTNIDLKFGFGIYNYYAAAVPEKYTWVKPLLFFLPKGNKKKGIEELENAVQKGKYTNYEAAYFLMSLYFGFEEDYTQADKWAEMLRKTFPDNPLFERYKGRITIRQSGYEAARLIYGNIYNKAIAKKEGYNKAPEREALYYMGANYFNRNQIDSSITCFAKCDSISVIIDKEKKGFAINTKLYLGKLYDIKKMRNKAIECYKAVLEWDDFRGSHQKADEYLAKPYGKN